METFISPVKITTGAGALQQVPAEIKTYGAEKVMIYADPGIVQIGLVNRLTDILKAEGLDYRIHSELEPEPPVAVGNKAVQSLREYDADIVIGIGGGSSLDVAKAAAVLHTNGGSIEEYLNLTGKKPVAKKGLPKILIPTTAGTGSEITDIAVFSLEGTKDVITNPLLLADLAVVDPELTYSVPPKITAATGVDALTHAVESLVSIHATPLTDGLALEAIRRLSGNIRTAVWNGGDVHARQEMAWGSLIAGLSFYNAGVSGVHALAYPLGGLFKLSHGESNAVMLPYVFDYIWPSCLDKMNLMAEPLGVVTTGLSKREAAVEAVRALYHITKDVDIPVTLKEFGIKEDDIERLAESGIKQKRLLSRSPKSYRLEDVENVYRAAYEGKLNFGE